MRYILPILFIILIISSCNPTKYVPEGETLLNENHIIVNKEGVTKTDLLPYIKQNPNKKIFGSKFYLGIYNLSNIKKEKWPHKWLREIGEEPVIFDPYSTIKSKEQIKSYVASKGYFDGQVMETVQTANRKSDVFYNVDLLRPYTIRNIRYEIADSNIQNLCYFDSVNCVIERGKPYDVDVLQAERSRFERFIKDRGFYGFSGDHISFRVDSTVGNRQVDIFYCVRNATTLDAFNRAIQVPHSIYRVRNVYIFPDFVPKEALEGGEEYLNSLDTINYQGYYFISRTGKPKVKYDLILQALYVKPGSAFNVTNTEQSQAHLLTLKVYRLVNIFYNDVNGPVQTHDKEMLIDCIVHLTLLSSQSFKVELEGTNSSGNLGGALNLIYQNKNLLHGAELFNVKLKGAYEARTQSDTILSTQEYGIETSLRIPKFLLPFVKTEGFIKKYNPTTTILAGFNYQNMPFYTRTMANATFGYSWKAGSYQEHIVNPLQLNFVNMLSIDKNFESWIASTYQASAYKDVLIFGGNYSYIFNNQKIQKSRDYWFFRLNAEASGNMFGLAANLLNSKKTESTYYKSGDTLTYSTYNIFGQPFAQYVKADLDLRYNFIINDVSSMVYRGFVGVGVPYGNSLAIPAEKQYFGGGANGIRAWQVRTLGPGSYNPDPNPSDSSKIFLNQTADIKLEANAEYRFKLFWILEGAVFVDAGNIWNYNNDKARPGSQFTLKNFYKDIAVGTGTGLRFDFKFVVGRVDLGMKLRDPLLTNGSKWIIGRRAYNFHNDFAIVLGIGYPF